MTRIAFVSDTIHSYFGSGIPEGTGGAERQQTLLTRTLNERGFDVVIVTLKHEDVKATSTNGIEIQPIIPNHRGWLNAPYKLLQTSWGLKQVDADVYYVRGNDFLCMVTGFYAYLSGAKFVYAVANDSNVDPELLDEIGFIKSPFLRAMKSADAVVAQTYYQQNILATEHGIDALQIPNGYEVPDESELLTHDEREHVLWVGSMDPDQKRPERFLQLALSLPDIQFRMIGPPDNDNSEHFDRIKTAADRIKNLEFLGYVDPDEIHAHYRNAYMLVNTSEYEGFPNTFLEAWRYATPVVSLHHTLDDTLIKEPVGQHAGTIDRLVDIVAELVSDRQTREQLGNAGRQHVIEYYSLDRLISDYETVFQGFCNG